jgi:hypothetical protein
VCKVIILKMVSLGGCVKKQKGGRVQCNNIRKRWEIVKTAAVCGVIMLKRWECMVVKVE